MQDPKKTSSHHYCLIALGGNLHTATQTALETLQKSLELFAAESLVIRKRANWYSSKAFPAGSGPDFVNSVVFVETNLTPHQVLAALHRIEKKMGRTRKNRWEPRHCDLDLIAFDDLILPDLETYTRWRNLSLEEQRKIEPDQLVLPHPRLQDRAFVLVPLRDVAPDWVHPVDKRNIDEILADIPDDLLIELSVISSD